MQQPALETTVRTLGTFILGNKTTAPVMSQVILPLVYTTLQPGEIRLLHSKIEDDGEITWTLTNAQLLDPVDSPLQFDALSYAWGELGETFPVNCNGRRLQIHHNLNQGLSYLARRRSSLTV